MIHTEIFVLNNMGEARACQPALVNPFFSTESDFKVLLFRKVSAIRDAPISPKIFSEMSK